MQVVVVVVLFCSQKPPNWYHTRLTSFHWFSLNRPSAAPEFLHIFSVLLWALVCLPRTVERLIKDLSLFLPVHPNFFPIQMVWAPPPPRPSHFSKESSRIPRGGRSYPLRYLHGAGTKRTTGQAASKRPALPGHGFSCVWRKPNTSGLIKTCVYSHVRQGLSRNVVLLHGVISLWAFLSSDSTAPVCCLYLHCLRYLTTVSLFRPVEGTKEKWRACPFLLRMQLYF